MKKWGSAVTIMAAAVMIGLLFKPVTAEAATSGNFVYEILSDGTAKITDYLGTETSVTIPRTLDGHTVSAVGYLAFDNEGIKEYHIESATLRIEQFGIGAGNIDYLSNGTYEVQYRKGITVYAPQASTAETYVEVVNHKYPHDFGYGRTVYSAADGWIDAIWYDTSVVWHPGDDWKFVSTNSTLIDLYTGTRGFVYIDDYDDDDDDDDDDDNSKVGQSDGAKPRITKVHWREGEKATFYWKYKLEAAGYRLEYSTDENFDPSKTKSVSRKKKEGTIDGLEVDRTYFIRVRPYSMEKGKKVWDEWSHRIVVKRKK